MNRFFHWLPDSAVGTDIQTALSKSLETKFRDAFFVSFFFFFFFFFSKCTFIMCCARWNWETNLKSLNDFRREALSVMWREAITLQNSSYPRQSINIHHPVTTHSSQNGKKRAEEGKVCVIPLIKSRESGTKVTFSSKIICSWQISVGRCYYSRMNSLALGKKFIFSEMGESKSLWSYSITT